MSNGRQDILKESIDEQNIGLEIWIYKLFVGALPVPLNLIPTPI